MANNIKEYNRKRQFNKTREPRGEVSQKPSKELRFVVQHHIASRDHYDFRLEWAGVLKSWAVPKGPSYDSRDKRLAVEVEDHPLDYRNFEGTIPKGQYGGGVVMIWDEGYWRPEGDAEEGLTKGSLKFTLEGSRLKGKWALVRLKPKPGEKNNNWLLIKEKDEYQNAYDVKDFDTSLKTGRSMLEIEEGREKAHEKNPDAKNKKAKAKDPNSAGLTRLTPAKIIEHFQISNPDKVLFEESGITKGEIAVYYHKVAARMLPYLENRLISAVRCPQGVEKDCFYKKHPDKQNRGLVSVPVVSGKGATDEYFYVADIYGLMSEVQMNTLEFHTWGSRAETLEKPDIMVFDLDPDEGLDLDQIRQGVKDLKGLLDELSLISFLKTSGGKGYHVVIPFQPSAGWDEFHNFAQNIAKALEARWPDRYTSNVRKNQRKKRIFIDWIRNGRGATSAAPYSVRAREGAPVSMPITWKELGSIGPGDITIKEAVSRLRRKDPWADFFTLGQRFKI